MLTQQRDSLDVNLNRVQQEAVSLRHTIEIITRDKAEMKEAKVEVKNVVVDLRRKLSKLKEAVTSLTESSVVENGRRSCCLKWAVFEKLQMKFRQKRISQFVARGQGEEIVEATTELEKMKMAQVDSLNIAFKFMREFY